MNIDKYLKNDTIWIIPSQIREKFISKVNESLVNIKIMTLDELKRHYYFDYDEKSIYYLIDKYNYTYQVAENYIKNMYYVKEDVNNELVKLLVKLKKELEINNLLYSDDLFKFYIKDKHIYIYGYDYLKKEDNTLINEISKISNIDVIEKEQKDYDLSCLSFNKIEDEVEYIATKIYDLLNDNVDINNIKLVNVDDSYKLIIEKIFKFYNIPVDSKINKSLYTLKIGKDFLSLIEEKKSNEEIINLLTKKYDNESINKIIKIINKYVWTNLYNVKEVIINDLKNTNMNKFTLKNKVEIEDINNNIFTDDKYIFLLGFNNKVYPKYASDEDLFSDATKEKLSMSTSNDINKMITKSAIKNIKSIKNLFITYKLKDDFDTFYPSKLVDDLEIPVQKIETFIGKSKEYNKIKAGILLDDLLKYGEHNNNLDILYNDANYNYLDYDNKFKGIDKELFRNKLNKELRLSYTSINGYFECPFKYYLSSVLDLNIYNETIYTKIGTLFHKILELNNDNDFDFEKTFENEIEKYKNNNVTKKELFYLMKVKREIKIIIDILKYQKEFTTLKNEIHEKKIIIDKSSSKYPDFKIIIKGYVDKIMYNDNNLAIIDYKTGNTTVDLSYLPFGLKMQLPVYIYLVNKCQDFVNPKIAGIYLQKVLHNIRGSKKGIEEEYKDALKLYGYSNSDTELLEKFDQSYQKSNIIKSMAITKSGDFYSYAKVLSNKQIEKITDIIDKNIDDSIENILNANFDIKPKRHQGINLSCTYCEFKDICFYKEEDYIDINVDNNLTFLGEVE